MSEVIVYLSTRKPVQEELSVRSATFKAYDNDSFYMLFSQKVLCTETSVNRGYGYCAEMTSALINDGESFCRTILDSTKDCKLTELAICCEEPVEVLDAAVCVRTPERDQWFGASRPTVHNFGIHAKRTKESQREIGE